MQRCLPSLTTPGVPSNRSTIRITLWSGNAENLVLPVGALVGIYEEIENVSRPSSAKIYEESSPGLTSWLTSGEESALTEIREDFDLF